MRLDLDDLSLGKVMATLIGTFTGAGLAFASSVFASAKKEDAANLAAGNLALFELARIYSDLLHLRALYWRAIDMRRRDWQAAGNGSAPAWLLPITVTYELSSEIPIDFQALSFLSNDEPGRDALIECHVASREFELLRLKLDKLQEMEVEHVARFAKAIEDGTELRLKKVREMEVKSFAQLAKAIEGARASDHVEIQSSIDHITRDRSEKRLLDLLLGVRVSLRLVEVAARHLEGALCLRFPKGVWLQSKTPVDDLAFENLPKLDAVYADQLNPAFDRAIAMYGGPAAAWLSNPPRPPWRTFIWRKYFSAR